jgi:hypothetical protein
MKVCASAADAEPPPPEFVPDCGAFEQEEKMTIESTTNAAAQVATRRREDDFMTEDLREFREIDTRKLLRNTNGEIAAIVTAPAAPHNARAPLGGDLLELRARNQDSPQRRRGRGVNAEKKFVFSAPSASLR